MLAADAEKAGTLPDSLLPDRRTTIRARLTGFSINQKLLHKVTGIAILVVEIAQCGSALLDGTAQHLFYGRCQAGIAHHRDVSSGSKRMDAAHKERFVGVDVADSDNDSAIHNKIFYCCPAPPGVVMQMLAVEKIGQRLRPQMS